MTQKPEMVRIEKVESWKKKTDEMQDKNDTIQESWILERRNTCNEIF
jgi:hypothetical protein